MDCELLTVGTELLLGFVVNTNAAEMGQLLAEAGVRVRRAGTVGDDPADVRQAVRAALDRTGTLIVTGGLGPTRDDLTKHAVAEVFGRRLVRDPAIAAQLAEWFARRGIPMAPENLGQADVPEGATVLPNPRGTAPGLWIEDGHGRRAILLPGVPKEMRGLLESEVIPRLQRPRGQEAEGGDDQTTADTQTVIRSLTVRTAGIGESSLHQKVGDLDGALPAGLTLAWLPGAHGVDLRLTAWQVPDAEARAALEKGAAVLEQRAAPHVYGRDGADLAQVVLGLLEARGLTLAVAESCTGGLLGARLTAVPGSSRVFLGGVVAYANDVKLGLLGVSADDLAAHGAVSEVVARALAEGAARSCGAGAALAITGIAGPDGGTDAKPVGTVWIALRLADATRAFHYVLPGDREDIRRRAAQLALDLLRRALAAPAAGAGG
jgi:nicotinamide-nucleotide amidase